MNQNGSGVLMHGLQVLGWCTCIGKMSWQSTNRLFARFFTRYQRTQDWEFSSTQKYTNDMRRTHLDLTTVWNITCLFWVKLSQRLGLLGLSTNGLRTVKVHLQNAFLLFVKTGIWESVKNYLVKVGGGMVFAANVVKSIKPQMLPAVQTSSKDSMK